ncbi:DUF2970 domain-containing protein [Aliikangiella maris]|uniref:DUF2970 domain-containing protein n=2 Tax=Aliikangiella maris TaxID=3162458 RepID=A0ABV3MSL8_9GAMM
MPPENQNQSMQAPSIQKTDDQTANIQKPNTPELNSKDQNAQELNSQELNASEKDTQKQNSQTTATPTKSPVTHPGFFSVLQSILAALIGVQSEEKRKQDFESGHLGIYLFAGLVMVIIFILVLVSSRP